MLTLRFKRPEGSSTSYNARVAVTDVSRARREALHMSLFTPSLTQYVLLISCSNPIWFRDDS